MPNAFGTPGAISLRQNANKTKFYVRQFYDYDGRNRLGIRVAVFATEDVGIARPGKLALEKPLKDGLLELLRESGIDFVDVPRLAHGAPPTSYKERGRSRLTFDLLVPTPGEEIETLSVPELDAHATGLPYLRYLLTETQMGAAISNHGVAAVRVPIPEPVRTAQADRCPIARRSHRKEPKGFETSRRAHSSCRRTVSRSN